MIALGLDFCQKKIETQKILTFRTPFQHKKASLRGTSPKLAAKIQDTHRKGLELTLAGPNDCQYAQKSAGKRALHLGSFIWYHSNSAPQGWTKFTQVDAGRGQNVTFDPLYLENFLELECHRCLMAQP